MKIAEEIDLQVMAIEPKKRKIETEEALVAERCREALSIQEECELDLSIAKPKLK
jgi:dynein heavy chain